MSGPQSAADLIAARLTATLGDRVWLDAHAARHGYDLTAAPLPTPGRIAGVDPGQLALEEWPAALATVTKTVSMKPLDANDDGSREQRVTYAVELLLLVRAEDETATDVLRKRYVLAAREALQAQTSLGDGATCWVLAEDYSAALAPRDGDVVAAARLSAAVAIDETIPGPEAHGTVLTTDASTWAL